MTRAANNNQPDVVPQPDAVNSLSRIELAISVAVSVLLASLVILPIWAFERPPVPLAKLNELKPGMSRDGVQAVLGKPSSTYLSGQRWFYSKPFGWSIVHVDFDDQGRYLIHYYDY